MTLTLFRAVQRIPASLDDAWDFFADPRNLARITPPALGIVITSDLPRRMHPGMIVTYTVRPFLGIPVRWVTEITHMREPDFFVDEQRFGPYRFWHHQHRFRAVGRGVEAEDIVHYALPCGVAGRVLAGSLVRGRLAEVFAFRRRALEEIFGGGPAAAEFKGARA